MDCDQVFMILTRGPFPTGAPTDEQVEAHLETCGDCWRLAEALRPALELFQEAVPPVESRDLPGYWGDARPAAAVMSKLTKTAPRLARSADPRPTPHRLPSHSVESLEPRFSSEILHTIAMISAFTAIVICLFLWLRG